MGGTNHLNLGAFCRLDVPRIVRDRDLAAEMASRGLSADTVLYTDTDVLFAANFEEVRQPPRTFSAATEVFSPSMNSGVMVMSQSVSLYATPSMEHRPTSSRGITLLMSWARLCVGITGPA